MQMQIRRLLMVGLFVACSVGLFPGSAVAWEHDVHYVLTFWLAWQAGFSREDAFAIAAADQDVDDGEFSSAIGGMIWTLLRGDRSAAENVRRLHFPSDAPFPSDPMVRAVAPNNPAARRQVVDCIKLDAAADALTRFGTALHPFQDSWSHQGVPDVPLHPGIELRPKLSSAHPQSRGGWNRHDADLTHLHVKDANDAARETYAFFRQYLRANPKRRQSAVHSWDSIAAAVDSFVRASTREAKNEWAARHIPVLTGPARTKTALTLPGLDSTLVRVRYLKPRDAGDGAPADLTARARDFMGAWLIKGDMRTASQFVDLEAVGQLVAVGGVASSNDEVSTWVRRTLISYLVVDHAAVNSAGHAIPTATGYHELPQQLTTTGAFRTRLVSDARLPAQSDLVPGRSGDPYSWILAVQRSDIPHDALALRWVRRGSAWVIAEMIPVVE